MPQKDAWEREYRAPKFVTLSEKPHNDVRAFWRFLKKRRIEIDAENLRVLDLGSGTGKHAFYFASLGAHVTGMEISTAALALARERAQQNGMGVEFLRADIGAPYPFADAEFDIVLDVLSSNSLAERERNVYRVETHRVLKQNGWLFVKALCKDGDHNAKKLLAEYPGKEHDTYTPPEVGITERVFSRHDFEEIYQAFFSIILLQKKTHYTRFENRSYRRNFWICYCQKRTIDHKAP